MAQRRHILLQGLVLVLTLALVAAGFGHRVPSGDELARAQAEQIYGSALCDSGAEQDTGQGSACPLCRLVVAFVLPAPFAGPGQPVLAPHRAAWPETGQVVAALAEDRRPPLRGPPRV
ncbi:hypothetical protein [Paracoccus sp. (in: a-proteobacteria)]|uniref:hypothetical protein n=1 Tax=Paracoccus sp. TaxID=267 RepID=UPI003A85B55F